MKIKETHIKDCFVLEPTVFEDDRGYFFESFNQKVFEELSGQRVSFVQDNQSFSSKGVLRGLHAQAGDYAQAKLVRVLKGKVLDVAVDARKDSATFGYHFSIILSDKNRKQLFIPRGFYHGSVVLSETSEYFYKCDNLYHKENERGVIYNDPQLAIDWKVPEQELVLSEKDKELPPFRELV